MEDRYAIRERKAGESLTVIPPPPVVPWDAVPREPHLLDYIIILRKHQWLILTFLVTVVTVVTIASFKMKPVYEAAASVEVDKEAQREHAVCRHQNPYDEYMDMDTYIETQTKILESETLAMQTIRSMDLGKYPEFGGSSAATAFGQGGATQRRPAILGEFLGDLSVRRVPNSRLIEVRFDAENPQLAAEVVNAHLQNYIEQNFKSKYDATTQASNWLSSELEELRIKVEKSEDARLAYERENQIWQIDEKQDITTQKLADLSKAVTDAQTALSGKEALYRMAMSGEVDAIPAVRDSAVISGPGKAEVRSRPEQYADASNQYGPNFPKVQRLKDQQKQGRCRSGEGSTGDRGRHSGGLQHGPQPRPDSPGSLGQAEGRSERHGGKAGAVQHPPARRGVEQAALRRPAAEVEGSRHHGGAAFEQHSNRGSRARAHKPLAAAEGAEHPAGAVCGYRGRNRAGDLPGVSGQHGEIARRHRNADRIAFAGRGAVAAGIERPPWSPVAICQECIAGKPGRTSRGASFLRAAEIADFGGVPGVADVAAACRRPSILLR